MKSSCILFYSTLAGGLFLSLQDGDREKVGLLMYGFLSAVAGVIHIYTEIKNGGRG